MSGVGLTGGWAGLVAGEQGLMRWGVGKKRSEERTRESALYFSVPEELSRWLGRGVRPSGFGVVVWAGGEGGRGGESGGSGGGGVGGVVEDVDDEDAAG